MFKWLKNFLHRLVLSEKSSTRLTLSFCLGNFIAWAPIIPFQTPLIFILSWLLRLNTTVTFATVYIINNPITIVPIYVLDYLVGSWILNSVLGLNMVQYNPTWVHKFSNFLSNYINIEKYFGSELCFWCLAIGGLILPLISSIILYFVMSPIFSNLVNRIHKRNKPYSADASKGEL